MGLGEYPPGLYPVNRSPFWSGKLMKGWWARQGAELWTPSETTTAFWIDGDDALTIHDGAGKVFRWDDKSGELRHMLQTLGSEQPTTGSTSLNGLNTVHLDGSLDRMHTALGATWLNNTDFTIFAVTDAESFTTENRFLACTGNANQDGNFDMGRADTDPSWGTQSASLGSTFWDYAAVGNLDPLLTTTQIQNPGSQAWIFGEDKGVLTNPTGPMAGITEPLLLGGPDLSALTYAGSIAEVVIIVGSVTTDIRQRIEGYLAWKWGLEAKLPIGHPYKTAPPLVA